MRITQYIPLLGFWTIFLPITGVRFSFCWAKATCLPRLDRLWTRVWSRTGHFDMLSFLDRVTKLKVQRLLLLLSSQDHFGDSTRSLLWNVQCLNEKAKGLDSLDTLPSGKRPWAILQQSRTWQALKNMSTRENWSRSHVTVCQSANRHANQLRNRYGSSAKRSLVLILVYSWKHCRVTTPRVQAAVNLKSPASNAESFWNSGRAFAIWTQASNKLLRANESLQGNDVVDAFPSPVKTEWAKSCSASPLLVALWKGDSKEKSRMFSWSKRTADVETSLIKSLQHAWKAHWERTNRSLIYWYCIKQYGRLCHLLMNSAFKILSSSGGLQRLQEWENQRLSSQCQCFTEFWVGKLLNHKSAVAFGSLAGGQDLI